MSLSLIGVYRRPFWFLPCRAASHRRQDRRCYPQTMNRRAFLHSAAAGVALAAGDPVRGAIIGAGGRGRLLTSEFKEIGVQMAAVCDIYEPNLDAGLQAASTGAKPYRDYRKLLEDKSIDAVEVATPDHWHAQMTIDAVEAGKDVYVEKPMAHTVEDGFRMIEAA